MIDPETTETPRQWICFVPEWHCDGHLSLITAHTPQEAAERMACAFDDVPGILPPDEDAGPFAVTVKTLDQSREYAFLVKARDFGCSVVTEIAGGETVS